MEGTEDSILAAVDGPFWWLILRANLDHEIHHRGALAVYLRVLNERD